MKTGIIYDSRYLNHDTGAHVENSSRLITALKALREHELLTEATSNVIPPRFAKAEELQLVHDKDYVDDVRLFCKNGGGAYDGDTVLSPQSYDTALLAAGGALEACDQIMTEKCRNAFVLARPPGHHSGSNGKALGAPTNGFCVFSNAAISAAFLSKKYSLKRIFIFDFDVHHGNGTQEIFYNSPNVLYASLHEAGIYPGTGDSEEIGNGEGRGYTINVSLPHRSDTEIYTQAFNDIIAPVLDDFKPEAIILSAGFDAHHSENIASMLLSSSGYAHMMKGLIDAAETHAHGRLVACLEGGYSNEALSTALPTVVSALMGKHLNIEDAQPSSTPTTVNQAKETMAQVKGILSSRWNV